MPKLISYEELKQIRQNGLKMTGTCEYEWRERFLATIESLYEEKWSLEAAVGKVSFDLDYYKKAYREANPQPK